MAFLKKFFKNAIHDRQPDNIVTVSSRLILQLDSCWIYSFTNKSFILHLIFGQIWKMIFGLLQVKEKKKPIYYGTVAPYPDFDPRSDTSNLQSSIEAKRMSAHFFLLRF